MALSIPYQEMDDLVKEEEGEARGCGSTWTVMCSWVSHQLQVEIPRAPGSAIENTEEMGGKIILSLRTIFLLMASYEFLIPLAVVLVFLTTCRSFVLKHSKDAPASAAPAAAAAAHEEMTEESGGEEQKVQVEAGQHGRARGGLLSLVVNGWRTRLARLAYVVSGPTIIQEAYNKVRRRCNICLDFSWI